MDFTKIWLHTGQIGAGMLTSMLIFFLTLIISLPLGMIVAKLRMMNNIILKTIIRLYLLVMRGTPLMLQLFFVMYFPPYILGFNFDRFLAVIIAFGLNYTAYFAEIYRGGIESVSKGQYEAAFVLGMSPFQTFRQIILPQVGKRILPSMANEFMTLVKDTSLAHVIGVIELFRVTKTIASNTAAIYPFVIAGIFYLIMNSVVAGGFSIVEKKLNYYKS